jgi:uncharacterized protein YdeI (YjbR/CyaY-like superfamily)
MKATRAAQARPAHPPAPPADFAAALGQQAGALTAFKAMSPSHRREYVRWITEAKRAETRARRIAKAVEMIAGRLPPGGARG